MASIDEKISINAPLKGEWKFLCPPGHHPLAFDLIKIDSNKKSHTKNILNFIFNKIDSKEYYCWEQPVFAPISGEVIRIANDWPDNEDTSLWKMFTIWYNAKYKFRPKKENGILDIRPNAGNHVMIKSSEGHIIFLAHFRQSSITVEQGQYVEQGDDLGLVGNSGNSTAPHLHINIFDQMDDPFASNVLPFIFKSFETLSHDGEWLNKKNAIPELGSLVKFSIDGEQS